MLVKASLIVFLPTHILLKTLIISPEVIDVFINSSIELTCYASESITFTKWETSNQLGVFSFLKFDEEGKWAIKGFLADTQYFETRCYSNATFKVRIKRVNTNNHGQKWYCSHGYTFSNAAFINVQVPTKFVRVKYIYGDVLKTVEKVKATLTCETSEGRPAANITWTKISKKGKGTDLTDDEAYKISRTETQSEGNLTIIESSIEIEPLKEDNETRIICEAQNIEKYVVRKEVTLYVQFPPSKPVLSCGKRGEYIVNETLYVIRNDEITLLCRSDGDPLPKYQWIGHSPGAGLYISAQTNTSKTCIVSNKMRETLGEEHNSSANTTVSIIVSYPPGIPYLKFSGHTEVVNYGTFLRNKIDIEESSTLTVTCKADGSPSPSCTWSGMEGRNSPDLVFTSITKESTGVYTCNAKNLIKRNFPAFEEKKNTATDLEIHVLYKSEIETFYFIDNEKREVSEVIENKTVFFICIVDGNPEPEIVLSSRGIELGRQPFIKTLIHSYRVTSCFDHGVYKCTAKINTISNHLFGN